MKCLIAVAMVSLVASPALGQSLGEVAKKERKRRQKLEEKGVEIKTLTEDDLATHPPLANRPATSPEASAPEESPEESEAVEAEPVTGAATAPPFTLEDRNGRRVSLRDFRGRPVLLDFWATWCGPCRRTMPEVEQLHRKYRRRGLQVVGINIEGRSRDVLRYLDQGGYSFLVLFDQGNWDAGVAKSYQVSSIPRTFLIDGEGNVVFSGHPNRLNDSLIESALR